MCDPAAEKHFIDTVLGLSLSHNNVLETPEIEEMVGLPTGCASEVSIWAEPCQPLGEVELVTYQGTDGANRYPRAQPEARGITHLNWWRDDLEAFAARVTNEFGGKGRPGSVNGSPGAESPGR